MSLETALGNVAAVALQGLVLVGVAALLARGLPLEGPRLALRWWQAVLGLVVGLPLVQPWTSAVSGRVEAWSEGLGLALGSEAGEPGRLAWAYGVVAVLGLGLLFRLVRLGVGLWRLHEFGARGVRLDLESSGLAGLEEAFGARAVFVLSDDVSVPATFGWRRPVVLLPRVFLGMSPERRRAVAAHELVHVRRGDWAATVAEETLAASLWFLPAVAFALSKVRLAREQVVDVLVVDALGRRDVYLESLVEMARHLLPVRPVPAALLLREHHLRARVELLLKEASMSKTRVLFHLAASAALVLLAGAAGARAFPLTGADEAKPKAEPARKEASAKTAPRLLHKVDAVYPAEAKRDRIEGPVVLSVKVGKDGAVKEAKVADGPAVLGEAALTAVRQWRWAPILGPDQKPAEVGMTLTIDFRLD